MRSSHLFDRFDSSAVNIGQKKTLQEELRDISENQLKGTDIEKWVKFFLDKYTVVIPKINRDGIESEYEDTQLNARHHRHRVHFSRDDDDFIPIPGTEIRFYVPYEGDPEFFGCSGNTLYASFPAAEISGNKLIFRYQTAEHDAQVINNNFERELGQVENHLRTLEGSFRDFNQSIESIVRQALVIRLEKFKKDDELGSKLKYPLKRREGAAPTYKVPEIRRAVAPKPLPPQKASTSADPTLEMEHYDHILTVVKNMVRVMEYSPRAFRELEEEDLRFHFLVQLNGHYEGMATGETFNYLGKTDIIIKYQGQNLFLAECKFWKGPKAYLETIDQILKYTTWRDTKTAIFVFNKDVDPAIPVQKIPEETAKHKNYLRAIPFGDGSSFRYVFRHPGDSSKELFLTVMVFNIPA